MRTKIYLITLLICVILTPLAAQQTAQSQSFSLKQAVEYGLANHNSIRSARMEIPYAEAEIKEYKAIGMPKLEGNINYQHFLELPVSFLPDFLTPAVENTLLNYDLITEDQLTPSNGGLFPARFGTTNSLSASLNFSTLIFDGAYFVGLKAIKGLREMKQLQIGIPEQEVAYNIRKAYLAVLVTREGTALVNKNITNLEKLLAETREIYKNGFAELLDVDRLELSLTNLQTEREVLQRQEQMAIALLKFQMQYPISQPLELTDKIADITMEVADPALSGTYLLDNRVEFQVLQKASLLSQLNIDRFRKSYFPSVIGIASYSQALQRNKLFNSDEAGFNGTSLVGVQVNVPIFDGFDRRSKIQKATIERDKIGLQIKDFEQVMAFQVESARIAYRNASDRLAARQKTVDQAERIFNTTQTKWREGVGSSFEVTNAEREVYTAQANFLNAWYDLANAKVDLEKALGVK
ncbi:MAG: TolC family protein [Saprospiraceae bacterium]|nr:TolC family protein [Saprospiraceae bacterium]